ncbi:hypothetical protein DFQ28_006292 [Apophysomyces sp. BC1034]|nr:hypothetical protein DFQ30_006158 [Apophysomyces sp. BC1015]KAG0177194.1 hypothetical protein DFQ29_005111 [Apophysomyces sp. BC1021]KAG0187476.1 hypothetical protein DFQ28_006292 [Apophysomyces sp. BC1034]
MSEKASDDTSLPRLFAISPRPTTRWQLTSINAELLASMLSLSTLKYPKDYPATFFEALDFAHLRIDSWEAFTKNPNCKFAYKILADGFTINLLFARKAKDKLLSTELGLDVFNLNDPGLSQVFTGINESGQTPHQVQRISSKEYYTMTGSTRRAKELQKEKDRSGIIPIETDMETCKAVSSQQQQHHQYVACFLRHFPTLPAFYGPCMDESRFRNYQGMQRAKEELFKGDARKITRSGKQMLENVKAPRKSWGTDIHQN